MTSAIEMHRAVAGAAGPTVAELVERCGRWSLATFGPTPAGSPAQELRLLVEVTELCLAAGASHDDIYVTIERTGDTNRQKRGQGYMESRPDPEKIPEEAADALVVLAQLAYRRGIDLGGETLAKQGRNEARKWKVNTDGTGQHIEPPGPGPDAHGGPPDA